MLYFSYTTHTHAGTKMCIGETAPPLQVVRETLLLLFPIIFNLTLFLRLYEWASKLHNKAAAHTFNQIMSRRGLLPLGTFCLFRNWNHDSDNRVLARCSYSSSHPQICQDDYLSWIFLTLWWHKRIVYIYAAGHRIMPITTGSHVNQPL